MTSDWKRKKIGELAKVISGYAFKSGDFITKGIPVIKIKNIKIGTVDITTDTQYVDASFLKLNPKYIISKGDVLISLTGSHISQPNSVVGRIARYQYKNIKSLLNQRVGKLLINKKYDNNFIYYLLMTKKNRLNIALMAHGAASQANISPSQVESLEVSIPENIENQRKIAGVLSAYDDLIENNNRRIAILEEMAQKLYKHWFVDFNFPNHENSELVPSELGLIPKGWEVKALKTLGAIHTGKTPSKQNPKNFGKFMPFIKTPDMHNGIFCTNTTELLSEVGANSQKNKILPANSICVSCIGTAGIVAITTENSQTNQQINAIVPNKITDREFIYFSMCRLKETIEQYGATGATMTNLSKGKFEQLFIVCPEVDYLSMYSEKVASMFEKIKNLSFKNQNLRQTRDMLLPRLISGEVDISELEVRI